MKIVFDFETGAIRSYGPDNVSIPAGAFDQPAIVVPDESITFDDDRWPQFAGTIADLKAAAAELVRDTAETYRSEFLTVRPGKHQAYVNKATVARRVQEAGASATAEDLDKLTREAAARGMTAAELADMIVTKAEAYEAINGIIEGVEAEGVAAIEAIDDAAEAARQQIGETLASLAAMAETEFAAVMEA